MSAPTFRIRTVELYERPVRLRLPFRFGVITLTEAPQAFVRLHIVLPDGREAWGAAAELMVPKWFDKDPALSNEQNFAQLRLSLQNALAAYRFDAAPRSAFGHSAAHHRALVAQGAGQGLNALVASYGPALLDRAVIDAVCRLHAQPFVAALQQNLFGIDAALAPDLAGFDIAGFLKALRPVQQIAARHTVGMLDPLAEADLPAGQRLNDGLPETLEGAIATYGLGFFKLKVGGNLQADLSRLKAVAAVLDRRTESYQASLDGNEQYDDADGIAALWQAMQADPALRRLCASILYIEQPIKRAATLSQPLGQFGIEVPVIVDESDADYDVFPAARDLGYRGISSKTCKGVYRAVLNAARCQAWNIERAGPGYFITGEDLTCQAGLALQQDLALVAALGLGHVERNGHHYVDGFGAAPAAEQTAFRAAHPDLYHDHRGRARLTIRDGRIALSSILAAAGFASAAEPDWAALAPMSIPAFAK